uniref:Histidine kinase/HSP90-like ATPase domain-containing protein n=2 Tax=Helicotheca tamesis TaxID=374047 RepID=A0A7S2MCM8_9STRA
MNGETDIGMIGQFGVGFYSTFLVADRVTVASKHPNSDKQYLWESLNGESSFNVAEDPRGDTLGRGTEITLHLKEDCEEYADPATLERLATHYSEFVTHPIQLRTTTTEKVEIFEEDEDEFEEKKDDDELDVAEDDETPKEEKEPKFEEVTTHSWKEMNPEPALWTRDKDSITDEEHQAFYHVLSKQEHSNATTWINFNAEGNINFKSLLYLPSEVPPELQAGQLPSSNSGGLKLYVRKVLISDAFDLLPNWLMFVKGVVDSEDLPLNVNRETLQESKIIKVIYKKLVRKCIEMIRKFSEQEVKSEVELDEEGNVVEGSEEEKEHPYIEWYNKFSTMLKVGAIEDEPNRGKIMKLLRFETSKTENGKVISLKEYVDNMKEFQNDIFFISGLSKEEVEKSQFMEKFREKDIEVIYMTAAIDEYLVQNIRDFDGKKFSAITKEGIKFGDEDEDLEKRRDKAYQKKFKPLTKWLKTLYGNNIMKVAISKRLGSSPAIISTGEWGHTANMQRIMQAQAFGSNDGMMMAMKILEINPRHPFILKLLEGAPPEEEEEGAEPAKVDDATVDAAWMIHDMALLNGGFAISDPKAYSQRMTRVLKSSLDVASLTLEEEIDPPVEDDEPPEIDMDGLDGINLQDLDDF